MPGLGEGRGGAGCEGDDRRPLCQLHAPTRFLLRQGPSLRYTVLQVNTGVYINQNTLIVKAAMTNEGVEETMFI